MTKGLYIFFSITTIAHWVPIFNMVWGEPTHFAIRMDDERVPINYIYQIEIMWLWFHFNIHLDKGAKRDG